MFVSEHFFDGYKTNPNYALAWNNKCRKVKKN